MIRIEASAWPREYARKFVGKLPSPYAHSRHAVVADTARCFPEQKAKRMDVVDMPKIYFEAIKLTWSSASGLVYYCMDWRQLGYAVPDYEKRP